MSASAGKRRSGLFVPILASILLCQAAFAWPQNWPFPQDPNWISVETNNTHSLAIGDIDLDGDLDLLCGNLDTGSTIYINERGLFTIAPKFLDQTEAVLSVALGDVDGDGDLDVVCGNSAQPNSLYLNYGGAFSRAQWTSDFDSVTFEVILADIDLDRDLDLVCANWHQSNTVYINTGGLFSASPDTISAVRDSTRSAALGDINGDGYLDLICGNHGKNTVYMNSGGVFESTPLQTFGPPVRTTDVALGDFDGDGDLDLVCSNFDRGNNVYLNQEGLFDTVAVWSHGADSTMSVNVGDVDGDGDLDLVFANKDQANYLFLNQGGPEIFSTAPVWSSGVSNKTTASVLGDLDGDGDLDFLCGNSEEVNTAYLSGDGPFQTLPDWKSDQANPTLSVDVGDVDGDGDPDLVCGNFGMNTLYTNDNGMFGTLPSWGSSDGNLTADVALGDIDGRYYLDLVCGNSDLFGQANTVYFNDGTDFENSAGWASQSTLLTLGIALGDVDDDGDIDLVCGNAAKPNTLHRNEGGSLSPDSVWSTGLSNPTTSVVLADVTGDDIPDLICGNSGADNTIYFNRGGLFSRYPDWYSADANVTGSVAVGDVNGDGLPDLVCGNDGQANTVYLNDGVELENISSWPCEPSFKTAAIALGDLNGDGYLDVVCGNLSQKNTAYMNVGGMFAPRPVWSSAPAKETEDIALCDVDGDGDLDLICGNELDSNTVYLGEKNPAFRGDPTAPTRHLTNNGAFLSTVGIEQAGQNQFQLIFRVVDVESDPVWVLAEYQFKGEPRWYPALSSVGSALTGPYDSSPAGIPGSLLWDITQIRFDTRDIVMRLKVIEVPLLVSSIQHATSYSKWLGSIEPHRAEITTSTGVLEFATITVGDTTSQDLVITNQGNIDLIVYSIMLPSAEMRVNRMVPFVIAPGTGETLHVWLEPLMETGISGSIEIRSNDPITPSMFIQVESDIRALEATSRLLTAGTVLPLGEAATVIVEPLPEVHVEGGTLFHRPAGTADFSPIRLGPSGDDFVAVIPGSSVTEVGLEYYVQIENLPRTSSDPMGAPINSPYFWPVEKPAYVGSSPRPTLNDDFIEGRSILVQVELPQGASFVNGSLYYCEGGVRQYEQTDLFLEGELISAWIPDSLVGSRGVDFWVQVETLTDTLTDPANHPASSPISIPVLVENLLEPEIHAGAGPDGSAMKYRLFSIPLKMRGSILGSIADELGGRDATKWRAFAYETGSSSYAEIPNESLISFEQGRAYWLITRDRHKIGSGPDRGETAPTDRPFEIALQPGYNLVGNPYTFAVSWNSMRVDTLSMDEAQGVLVEPPYGWIQDKGLEDKVYAFQPFDGYWVKNLTPSTVILKIPAIEAVPAPARDLQNPQIPPGNLDHWNIRIVASSRDVFDASGVAGVTSNASTGWDAKDRSKPPLMPGEMISLYFPHASWTNHPGCYGHDVRGKYETSDGSTYRQDVWGHIWRFDVNKNFTRETAGDEVMLTFEGIANVPREASVYLIDNVLGCSVDLRAASAYRYYQGIRRRSPDEKEARFSLVVGNEPYVTGGGRLPAPPSRTRLHQNYPNPFNPSTIIRYELAEASHVSIRIFDAGGARVRDLYSGFRQPGIYEIGWDARDASGQAVATGIYFCRFEAGQTTETRKMLLLK